MRTRLRCNRSRHRSRFWRWLRNLLKDRTAFLDRLVRAHHHGEGANHEHDRAPGGSFGENVCRTARAESRLTARAAKSARKVCGFAALQQHHNHKNKAVQNKEGFQDPGAAPGEAEANPDDRESDGQRDGPFHPRRHFYLLTNGPKYFGTDSSNLSRRQLPGSFDDGRKRFCVETRSAHQRTVQFFLRHQSANIVRLHAATVENAQIGGMSGGEFLRRALAKKSVNIGGHFRCSGAARPNGPYWLVSYQHTRELLRGQRAQAAEELPLANLMSLTEFTLDQGFADTNDGNESRGESCFGFLSHGLVGFAKKLPALGVADDDVPAAGFDKHIGGDFAGEGPLFFPVDILRGDGDVRVFGGFNSGGKCCERRSDDNVAMLRARDERSKRREERVRFRLRLEHFPVAGNHVTTRHGVLHPKLLKVSIH